MKLKEIMTTEVEVIHPDMTLIEAAQKMKEMGIGALPVCDGDRLTGMVTDRDIVVRGIAANLNPEKTPVRSIMSSPIIYCYDDMDAQEAARIMEVKQIRRLAVLSREKRMIGIASLGDLAVTTGNEELAGEVLEEVSKPVGRKQPA
jgi:CBS domain-containing protein